MIYLDTSVALAHLLGEDRVPPSSLWSETVVSSRLLEYEIWTHVNGRRLGPTHGDAVRALLAEIAFIELTPTVLARVLEPFPLPLRTLDALHLSSIEFLRSQRQTLRLASYDERMLEVARALGIGVFE
jgi:predicted nucleic acid-binding protein